MMKKLMTMTLFTLLILGLSGAVQASPETGIFSGTVVDAEYGEAVAGAMVFVRVCMNPEGGPQGTHLYSTTTNEFGEFFIDAVPVGEWTAVARLKGVGRDEELILIEAGAETIVAFELADGGCPGGLQMRLHQGGN